MKHKIVITSLTAAALATVSLTNINRVVKADTVSDTTTQKAQSPKEIAQNNITSAQ